MTLQLGRVALHYTVAHNFGDDNHGHIIALQYFVSKFREKNFEIYFWELMFHPVKILSCVKTENNLHGIDAINTCSRLFMFISIYLFDFTKAVALLILFIKKMSSHIMVAAKRKISKTCLGGPLIRK